MSEHTPPEIPGVENLEEIGKGASARVYRARLSTIGRTVAVKVFDRTNLDDSLLTRFERECRVLGALADQPSIVQVHWSGTTAAGHPYLIMEYLGGGSLADRLRRDGPLSWREATRLAERITRALEVAHELNIIHRDVKPANVLLSDGTSGGAPRPVLCDFGIARMDDVMRVTTSAREVRGTLVHLAPELLLGAPPSHRSDLYAVGSTLFELVAGRPAFDAGEESTFEGVKNRVLTEPVPDLRPQGVPERLWRIIEHAMAKDPADRPESAAVLASMLAEVAAQPEPAPATDPRPLGLDIDGLRDFVEVGRGGFGTVYRAFEERFEREVAVKVLRDAGLNADSVARFERECRALGALSGHPNIVAVHGSGRTGDGDLFLAMEYLPGGSLARPAGRTMPADPEDVLQWGVALAGALETAHQSGIIHRDVKPDNVLFSALGTPKLVDFGIARMRSAYETRTGAVSATLAHAAPEVIAGASVSPAADVYSLASTLYFALAASAPFDGTGEESLAPLLSRITTQPPPDLRQRGIPDSVAAVIEQGLAKTPDERFGSARAFGEALRAAAVGLGVPVSSLPISAAVPAVPSAITTDVTTSTPPTPARPVGAPRPVDPPPATPLVTPPATPLVTPVPAATAKAPKRRRLLASAAAVVVVGLVAGGMALFAGDDEGGRDDPEEETAAPVDSETPISELQVVFEPEGNAEVGAQRRFLYSADGARLLNQTTLTNNTDAPIETVWFEVVPKELAAKAGDVLWTPPPTGVVVEDPVVWFQVPLAPRGEYLISWETTLDAMVPSIEHLETTAALHRAAVVAAAAPIAAKTAELAAAGQTVIETEVPDARAVERVDESTDGSYFDPTTGAATSGGDTTGGATSGPTTGGAGGTTSGPTTGGGGGTTSGPTTGGTSDGTAANRAPSLTVSNQSHDELAGVNVTFSASDPDNDALTYTISGLPTGLSASGNRVTGTVSHNAASVTTTRTSIQSKAFTVSVTAKDSKNLATTKQLTWTIRDTHTVMPNYIDKYGCGARCTPNPEGSFPDVAQLATYAFQDACVPGGNGNLIYRQSIAPNTVVAWGQSITFWYGWDQTIKTGCQNVAKGWP